MKKGDSNDLQKRIEKLEGELKCRGEDVKEQEVGG